MGNRLKDLFNRFVTGEEKPCGPAAHRHGLHEGMLYSEIVHENSHRNTMSSSVPPVLLAGAAG